MQHTPSIKLTLEQRKLILQLMNYSYTIPVEFHHCVANAIKKYATKTYSDEAIMKMVQKSQSVANSGFLLREDSLSFFRGKFAEWLACIEYNALKNSGSVIMTIVNPDETSKADLLHFIKVGDGFKAVAGPDIKSGGSTYVFNQWKKIVTSRHDIPMVDFDDILTTEEGLKQLTKGQRKEFEQLCETYPSKRPVPTKWTNQDELRLRTDYFKSVLNLKGDFKYTPEITEILKKALANQKSEGSLKSDWLEFNKKCKEIFHGIGFSSDQETRMDLSTDKRSAPLRHQPINNYKQKYIPKPKNYGAKSNIKGSLLKVVKGLLIVGPVFAGTVIAVKNPKLGKKIINNTIKVFRSSQLTTKATNVIRNSDVKEPLGGTHVSPILHKVSSYVRKNGTIVKSYMRGKNKL